MQDNIIIAYVTNAGIYKTRPLYQFDYGQRLIIQGIDLPQAYEVHFANDMSNDSITQIGDESGVSIPDSMLLSGLNIQVWLYLHSGRSDGETVYKILIPVIRRAAITGQEPTPVQQSAITEAIAALNTAVEQTAEDVTAAAASAASAQQSAEDAAVSADHAEQAAAAAGYMAVGINEYGHLILERTGDVNVDFSLSGAGHLMMEGV